MPHRYAGILRLDPNKRSGKPTIRGMRITVYNVLSYLATGMTQQQILDDFPYCIFKRVCLQHRSLPHPSRDRSRRGTHRSGSGCHAPAVAGCIPANHAS